MPKENAVDKHIWFNLDDRRDKKLWEYTKEQIGEGTFSGYVKDLIDEDRIAEMGIVEKLNKEDE